MIGARRRKSEKFHNAALVKLRLARVWGWGVVGSTVGVGSGVPDNVESNLHASAGLRLVRPNGAPPCRST